MALPRFQAEYGRAPADPTTMKGLFRLPAQTRFYIWKLLLDQVRPGTSPIRLAGFFLYKDVWTKDKFTTMQAILRALGPYLSVSFDFHTEIMLTLLMTEYFHVIFSPFTQRRVNQLASMWLPKYGQYMRRMIVEMDMSRFSFGVNGQQAMMAGPHMTHSGSLGLDRLIEKFVETQLKRKRGSSDKNNFTMEKLFLLCRRFYGVRPSSERQDGQSGGEFSFSSLFTHAF